MGKKFYMNCFYHVFNKSIANYEIFRRDENKQRFLNTLDYYNNQKVNLSFSAFLKNNHNFKANLLLPKEITLIKFISYCLMPDHYHLLVKILFDNKFSKYISDVENSFTRFFNEKNDRKGPLWQSRFKATKIDDGKQLLHVSRYIHLNTTTNRLVNMPEDWQFSSYREIISNNIVLKNYLKEISISNRFTYKKFVERNKDYQRKLKLIKRLIFE